MADLSSANLASGDATAETARVKEEQQETRRGPLTGVTCPQCGTAMDVSEQMQYCRRCHTCLGYEGTGRPRRGDVRPTFRCVDCGEATPNAFFVELTCSALMTQKRSGLAVARCDRCERQRNRKQDEAVAANEAVYPHLREEARQRIQEGVWAA